MKIVCDLLRVGDSVYREGHSAWQDPIKVEDWILNTIEIGTTGECFLDRVYSGDYQDYIIPFKVIEKYTSMIEVEIDISSLDSYTKNELINYSEFWRISTIVDDVWEIGVGFKGYVIKKLQLIKISERKQKIRPYFEHHQIVNFTELENNSDNTFKEKIDDIDENIGKEEYENLRRIIK